FVQDQWAATRGLTVNYGLRWDAQRMPETVDPTTTAFAAFLKNPLFPSDGTIPSQWAMFQPRLGATYDVRGNGQSVVRGSFGIYFARQNMLSQVGSVTTNGVQQQTLFADTQNRIDFGAPLPTYPGLLTPPPVPEGTFPLFTGVRVFDRDYRNPRIYTVNVGYEQQIWLPDFSVYADYTYAHGSDLTRFLNYNRSKPAVCCDATGDHYAYLGAPPFGPQLDEVQVTTSRGKSNYNGLTLGARKRFSRGYQIEANYTLSRDKDDDSNERDPFTDYSFNFFDLSLDYALSTRDITNMFNLFGYFALPQTLSLNVRLQGRGAQPITPEPRALNGVDRGRNTLRKDNEYFSLDWRLTRAFRLGGRAEIIPMLEMFNTFNNDNNINPLTTNLLFDFSGFLRTGVGDPRQVQLAVKVTF